MLEKQTAQSKLQAPHYHTYNIYSILRQGPPQGPTREDIMDLLHVPAFHIEDVEHILRMRESIPNEDRARAERLLTTRVFRSWIVAPSSRELLVHGDFVGTRHISGLSWLCCCLLQALQQTGRLHSLTFFCGRHLSPTDAYAGGCGIIRSLLLQLLWQQQGDIPLEQNIDWNLVRTGDIPHLCLLFESILCRWPPGSVVFCIIDGIRYYERDQYLREMSEVLRFLLDLTHVGRLQCVFKILVTSPAPTNVVRRAFDPGSIISMASLPRITDKSSSRQVFRHLEEDLA